MYINSINTTIIRPIITFFFNDKRLITIHQIRFDFIDSFNYQFEQVEDLVLFLIHKMINTYQPPLNELDKKIEELENIIFLKNDINISVDDLYYLKMQLHYAQLKF